ncbi:MAG TPA: DUF3883 domain-containing protein [Mucilaginibacter sp.]
MDLPDVSTLNLFNKVLISLTDLCSDGNPCSLPSLITQCKSVAFGGHIVDYDIILNHCKNCGLIQIKKNQAVVTVLGQKFLDANRNKYFEITEAQKEIVAERIVFKGSLNTYARELFEFFSPNFETATYEVSVIDTVLPVKQNSSIHFFKHLGIIHEEDHFIHVNKKYSELVYQLTADSKAISEEQLEKILMENRKLGAQAEIAVVEFERKRLKKLGRFAQAEMVKRISTINTSAGYDIESFDGTTDNFIPDRFIEVKATQGNEIRFYWSNNEMNIAKKKKLQYWIYFMKAFKENKPSETNPLMIQHPNETISKQKFLAMEAHTVLIKEISEVELTYYNIEEIIWSQLI